ncbi:MAG: hypothetical protein JOZ62_20770 [Acidobacteriaceae bacterium]|nr:hypothetical protein [Acidobacteriaceae bacterium]
MSTQAQIAANQANAQHSTGPRTEEGKAASCRNNFRHGFTGAFNLLPSEDEDEFNALVTALRLEHNPSTPTENILVDKMAQHFWLTKRAQLLQDLAMAEDRAEVENERQFALFLRYQTTNDRAFHKCLDQLLKLRAEKRKAEIGFESQERKRNEESRRQAEQARKQEAHEAKVRLANAKAAFQELETEIKSTIDAVLPGHTPIPFSELKTVLKLAIEDVARTLHAKPAANAA